MNATNGNVNLNGQLEQQLFELVYGLLEPDEAQALRRRVTSEPEVARAYARVVQQSERLALAAQWEEPPLPLAALLDTAARGEQQVSPAALAETPALGTVIQIPASAKQPAAEQPAAKKIASQPTEEIVPAERAPGALRWLAAIAGGMVAAAVLVAACLVPRAGAGGTAVVIVPEPPLLLTTVTPKQITLGDETLVTVRSVRAGEPVQVEFDYLAVNGRGEEMVKGRGTTDLNGFGTFNLPGQADGTARLDFSVEAAGSPPVEGQIEMVPAGEPRDGLNIETDRLVYTAGDDIGVRVWPVDKTKDLAELSVAAVDARGLKLSLDDLELKNEVLSGKLTVPVNSVPGLYDVRAERRGDGEVASQRISVRESADVLRDKRAETARIAHDDFVVAGSGLSTVTESLNRAGGEANAQGQAERTVEEFAEIDEAVRTKLVKDALVKDEKEVKEVKRLILVQDESGRVLDSQLVPAEAESRELHKLGVKFAQSEGHGMLHSYDIDDLGGSAPATPDRWYFRQPAARTISAHISEPVEVADREVTFHLEIRDGRNQPIPSRYSVSATFQRAAEGVETALGLGVPLSGTDAAPPSQSYAFEYAQWRGQGRPGGGAGIGGGGLEGGGFAQSGKLAEGLEAATRGGAAAENERLAGLKAERESRWVAEEGRESLEKKVTLVKVLTYQPDALTRYGRLFTAGTSPHSFGINGELLAYSEQPNEWKETWARGPQAGGEDFTHWEDLAKRESETRAGRPGLQVRSNGAALDEMRRAGDDSGLAQPGQSEPIRWAWIFLAAGGGVMLLGTAISWTARPDPWAVWLPAGLIAVACFAAGSYHGWPSESTATQFVTVGATPPAAAVLPAGGEELEANLKTLPAVYATPETTDAYTHVQFRQLAVMPRFDAGDAPSNAVLFGDLAETKAEGDHKANEPPAALPTPAPAESAPAAPKPQPIVPVNPLPTDEPPTDEPLAQPPRTPALTLPEKPGTGDPAGTPYNRPIAGPGPSVPGGVPAPPLGEVGGKDPARVDGLARDFGYGNGPAPIEPLHWEPAGQTDARGRAQVRLKLPPGPGFYKVRVTADRDGDVITTERIFPVK